ncbi:hypothetical protein HK405_014435, partial [Cladochytrium tenue]
AALRGVRASAGTTRVAKAATATTSSSSTTALASATAAVGKGETPAANRKGLIGSIIHSVKSFFRPSASK